MIVGDIKPIEEIVETVADYRQIHVVGCGSCVTVCLAGGDRETHLLAEALSHPRHYTVAAPKFTVDTIERQCERDLVSTYLVLPENTEAVLSLACGVGVQCIADVFDPLPVYPALNTTFMGGADNPGVWSEKCRGCGDCILTYTAGICPVARCAKRLFNGPCGGSQGGACEVDDHLPCAWALIYYRLKKQDKLHLLMEIRGDRDWRRAGGNGPRQRIRTGIGK